MTFNKKQERVSIIIFLLYLSFYIYINLIQNIIIVNIESVDVKIQIFNNCKLWDSRIQELKRIIIVMIIQYGIIIFEYFK